MASVSVGKDDSDCDIISEVPSSSTDGTPNAGNIAFSSYYQSPSLTQPPSQQAIVQTVPPKASNNDASHSNEHYSGNSCLECCCMHARDEAPSGFNQLQQGQRNQNCCMLSSRSLRLFLSCSCMYIYVISMTFILVLLLLAELLIDVGIIVVPDVSYFASGISVTTASSLPPTPPTNGHVVEILHWINFSLLCVFFLEVLLRLYAWKTSLLRSLPAVFDSAAVVVAIVVNIATTAAAGYGSPFNGISLIVVFRFVRIYSLIQCYVLRVKDRYRNNLAQTESKSAELLLNNERLKRQISEKDYEIKQLRAHLSQFGRGVVESPKTSHRGKNKDSRDNYDAELQRVLALSKQEYEHENGVGFDNPAYVPREKVEDLFVPSITVHHRENSMKRGKSSKASTSKDQSTFEAKSDETASVTSLQQDTNNDHITHGELHSCAETESQTAIVDTTLLLRSDNNKPTDSDHYTVGYCLMEHPSGAIQASLKAADCDVSKKMLGIKEIGMLGDKGLEPCSIDIIDEGIGQETITPATKKKQRKKHRRARSIVSSTDDTLSDPGCISASSLYSESGYQSDDLPYATTSSKKEGYSSIRDVIPSPFSSPSKSSVTTPSDIDMVILQEEEIEKSQFDTSMEEDEL